MKSALIAAAVLGASMSPRAQSLGEIPTFDKTGLDFNPYSNVPSRKRNWTGLATPIRKAKKNSRNAQKKSRKKNRRNK